VQSHKNHIHFLLHFQTSDELSEFFEWLIIDDLRVPKAEQQCNLLLFLYVRVNQRTDFLKMFEVIKVTDSARESVEHTRFEIGVVWLIRVNVNDSLLKFTDNCNTLVVSLPFLLPRHNLGHRYRSSRTFVVDVL
jgi:hypothetical protein